MDTERLAVQKQEALNLMKTARGQIDAAIAMLADDRYCVDVCKQILAVQSLLKKANNTVLHRHVMSCVSDAVQRGEGREKVQEIFELIDRYAK